MSDTPVKSIEFTTNEEVKNVKVTVKEIQKPSSVSEPDEGDVYEYIEITASNINESQIDGVFMIFSVRRDWLSSHGYEEEQVVLIKYNDNTETWEWLTTEVTSETNIEVTYRAETPIFPVFAAWARKPKETEEPTEQPE